MGFRKKEIYIKILVTVISSLCLIVIFRFDSKSFYSTVQNPSQNLVTTAETQSLIINEKVVSQFPTIPGQILIQASGMKVLLRHASVGSNINGGLDALHTQNTVYDRTNWSFQPRGNPGWQAKINDLDAQTELQLNSFDVFSMKFCYIDNNVDPAIEWDYYRTHMEALQTAHPDKKFVWWTMPIMTSGDGNRDRFNTYVRTYAQTHPIILFDVAAIESHDPVGIQITNNGFEAMYSAYSSDGGHLTDAGGIRVAQAWWYLIARMSGWDGSPYSIPTPADYDLNGDGFLDQADFVVFKNNYLIKDLGDDFNTDGLINSLDFNLFKKAYRIQ